MIPAQCEVDGKRFIELEPMLDLLEEAHNAILEHLKLVGGLAFPILQGRMEELGALLHEHGRQTVNSPSDNQERPAND